MCLLLTPRWVCARRAHDHTVVGEIDGDDSWSTLAALNALPAKGPPGGMTMLTKQGERRVASNPLSQPAPPA